MCRVMGAGSSAYKINEIYSPPGMRLQPLTVTSGDEWTCCLCRSTIPANSKVIGERHLSDAEIKAGRYAVVAIHQLATAYEDRTLNAMQSDGL
ncbi:hypothetical protein SRB17_10840 [Streptomyces sp. RB17]|nr:hypothetical protein [Streptomyces sp. RB17]